MRIPRFRIRTLMIVVAITAVVSAGAVTIHRRSLWLHERSVLHQQEQLKVLLNDLEIFLIMSDTQIGPDLPPSQVQEILNRIDQLRRDAQPMLVFLYYHDNLAEKYERAARRPWLSVTPDPPPPPEPSREYQKAFRARNSEILLDNPTPRTVWPTSTNAPPTNAL